MNKRNSSLFRLELSNGYRAALHHTPLTPPEVVTTASTNVDPSMMVCVDCIYPEQIKPVAFILPVQLLTTEFIEEWAVKRVTFFQNNQNSGKVYVAITRIEFNDDVGFCGLFDSRLRSFGSDMLNKPLTGLDGKEVDASHLHLLDFGGESHWNISIPDAIVLLKNNGFVRGHSATADFSSVETLKLESFADVDEAALWFLLQESISVKVEFNGRTAYIRRLVASSSPDSTIRQQPLLGVTMSENNHDNTEAMEAVMKKPSDDLPALSAEAWLRYRRNAVIGAFTPDWASFNDLHSADTHNQSSMRIFENALARLKERGRGTDTPLRHDQWLSTPGKSDLLQHRWLRGVQEHPLSADELNLTFASSLSVPFIRPEVMELHKNKPQEEHKAETCLQACNRDYDPGAPLSTPGMQLARNPLGELRKYAMLDVNHEGGRDARSWFAENSLKDTLSTTCSVVTPETLSEHKKACSEALNGIADSFHRFLRRVRKVVFLSQLAKDAPKDATELYGVPLHYFRQYELMFTYVTNDTSDPLKTVVDWEGLRALAAKDAAEEVTANKRTNLMMGMDGSSNYGHRFTR